MTSERNSEPKAPRAPKDKTRRPAQPAIGDPIQRAIGDKLKAEFEAVAQQPVPDRFLELLRRLEEQERQKK